MAGRKKGYGQFCPIAQAAEVVAERWTPLVLRELIAGSHRFNEIRRGVPLISPSLLSQRLRELESAGLVERRPVAGGKGSEYHLTRSGEEIAPVIEGLGAWGARWLTRDLRQDELDPALLMWDVRRRADAAAAPGDRTVVHFRLRGAPRGKGRWWLVFDRGEVDLCLADPGHEVDLHVTAPLRTLVDVWMGREPLTRAVRSGAVELDGSRDQVRAFTAWFRLSVFADAT